MIRAQEHDKVDVVDTQEKADKVPNTSTSTQTISTGPVSINYEFAPAPTKERVSYSIGIQTTEPWSPIRPNRSTDGFSDSEADQSPSLLHTPRKSKRLSRREREREEELRQNLRQEIMTELKSIEAPASKNPTVENGHNFPLRLLNDEEASAVTSSEDFLDFVERSSKVIEKALDQEYDILADYAIGGFNGLDEDDDEGYASSRVRKSRRIKEIAQFYDERWSKKRMISDINFSLRVYPFSDQTIMYITKGFTSSFPNSC